LLSDGKNIGPLGGSSKQERLVTG